MDTMDQLLAECSIVYTRAQFEADRTRLLAVISAKHGIPESEVPALISEHRYVHSEEDPEQDYIEMMAMARGTGWPGSES